MRIFCFRVAIMTRQNCAHNAIFCYLPVFSLNEMLDPNFERKEKARPQMLSEVLSENPENYRIGPKIGRTP